MEKLPIITQAATTPDPRDVNQFQEVPVVAITDALAVPRGGFALFTVYLLDSPGPCRVNVYPNGKPSGGGGSTFFELLLTQEKTIVSIDTSGGMGPFPNPQYFNVYIAPLDPCYIVREIGVGTITETVAYHVYAPGVYLDSDTVYV